MSKTVTIMITACMCLYPEIFLQRQLVLHACPQSHKHIWLFLGQQISDLRSRPEASAPYGQRGEMIIHQRDEGTRPNIMEIWSEARAASTSSPSISQARRRFGVQTAVCGFLKREAHVLSAEGGKLAFQANIWLLQVANWLWSICHHLKMFVSSWFWALGDSLFPSDENDVCNAPTSYKMWEVIYCIFCTRTNNSIGQNKSICSSVFAFHSFWSHPAPGRFTTRLGCS